ncbi:MAG TPA: peptidoglycan-associated lipoprotein Pal [Paracoccaceae bacterium]|nr:peptidoglycan-associated lipoprotein Pal [Paracoccaceae bacterium]
MTFLRPFAALALALVLSACASNEIPEDAAAGAGVGSGASGAASPFDPASVEYFRAEIGDTVYFATDSSLLTPDAQSTLTRQARWLTDNPVRTATIEGHADERGTREYNLALGARRASAVRNFLVAEGVQAGRLRSVTYGKERPVALCSDESCWRQNRRAVTVMADGPTS